MSIDLKYKLQGKIENIPIEKHDEFYLFVMTAAEDFESVIQRKAALLGAEINLSIETSFI